MSRSVIQGELTCQRAEGLIMERCVHEHETDPGAKRKEYMISRIVFHTPVERKSKIKGTLKRKKQIPQAENMEIGLLRSKKRLMRREQNRNRERKYDMSKNWSGTTLSVSL